MREERHRRLVGRCAKMGEEPERSWMDLEAGSENQEEQLDGEAGLGRFRWLASREPAPANGQQL